MRFLFAIVLMSISSHALADEFISYKCIMHRHIILMDHKTTEGVLDTFEITENDYELHLSGWYFDGLDLPLESSSSEYIEAKDESGRIFTFWRGQFHFSYISHKHISSISGECLPIPRLNES